MKQEGKNKGVMFSVPVCFYNTRLWPRTVDTQNKNSDFAVVVGTGDFFPSSDLVDTTLDLLSKCIIKLGREKGAVRLPRLWLTVTLSHNKAGKPWNYLGAQPSYNPQSHVEKPTSEENDLLKLIKQD